MRSLLFCLAMIWGGAALADELAEANAALLAKSYPAALASFSKLAEAGNAEAQLRLGEMYWYGEGVALDRARGDALFAQAAAAGNKDAAVAQTLSARRIQQSAGIAYWTSGYDGADLSAGKFNCVAPTIPKASTTSADIKATTDAIAAWQSCYYAFAANMNDAQPVGKRIPAEVVQVMSEQELKQARAHLHQVYGVVSDKAKASAAAVAARRDQWQAATVALVEEPIGLNLAATKLLKDGADARRAQSEAAVMNDPLRPGFKKKH